jgi:argininosuccinate lyase
MSRGGVRSSARAGSEAMRKQKSEEYRGYRRAGIRLTEEVLPNATGHRIERVQQTLYAAHLFDKAHLVMLTEEGLIPRADGIAMLRELRATEQGDFIEPRRWAGGGDHSGENYLIRRLGEEVGGRIHLGRSSGDLGAVSTSMAMRDKLLEVMAELNVVRKVVIELAEQHVETVMPGYTHGQHAQPITLGHQLASWAAVLERDVERARQAYRRINLSPAGAAIMSGSDFPLNRHRTSELLGYDRPHRNTFDAIQTHDTLLDTFCVLAILNTDMARWADDLMTWSANEFGVIDIPDRFCGTSSIMMQKKNPYAPQYIKGLGAATIGAMVTAFMIERGQTSLPVTERSYSTDGLWRVFDDTLRDLKWWQELLPEVQWNTSLLEQRAGEHWAQATDVAGALVRDKGLPWRTAHQIVGILVRHSYEQGFTPQETTPERLDAAAVEYMGQPVGLSDESLQKALDPRHFVTSRTLYGGPAPDEVREQLVEFRARLELDEAERAAASRQIAEALQKLEAAIDALLG